MEFNNFIISITDGIGLLKVNRPKVLNAFNTETVLELEKAIEALDNDDTVKVIIITGEGEKAFVAGADIAEMRDMNSLQARNFSQTGQRVLAKIENIEKPVIAAINGFALGGGCELALACDIRIASEKAKLGLPEVTLGVFPGFAGTQRLARLCGPGKAKELIFSGVMIDALQAEKIGLVNKVVAPESLLEEVEKLAKKIMANGPLAVRIAKTVINRGLDSNFQTGSAYEAEAFGVCFSTDEPKEGMSAFLEKRKAEW
jgi:enoyl-CoA hydratase